MQFFVPRPSSVFILSNATQPLRKLISKAAVVLLLLTATHAFAAPVSPSYSTTAPATAVGSTSITQTATITFTQSGTLNTTLATAIRVLTQGAAGTDYNYVTGGSCTPGNAYTAGSTCTVNFTFSPKAPGVRLGAVTLYDGSATPVLVATQYLGGLGNGALGVFTTPTASSISNLTLPRGLSVDSTGNVFVNDYSSGKVYKFPAGTTTGTVLGTLAGAAGNAVDGAGNLYVASGNAVYEFVGGVAGTPLNIATINNADNTLVIDAQGNLYASSDANNTIQKIAPVTHTVIAVTTAGSTGRIIGFAVDPNGNLFLADFSNNKLDEVLAGTNTVTTLVTGGVLSAPDEVAIDPAGNVYVGNYNNSAVYKYAAGVYTYTGTSVAANAGLAIDSAGNLYAINNTAISLYKRTAGPAVNFGTLTLTNSTTTSAPQSTPLENDGNQTLLITAAATSTNFALDTTNTCNAATGTLIVNGTCNLVTKFAPTTLGTFTGTATITDNSLAASGASQTQALSGTAVQVAGTPGFTGAASPSSLTIPRGQSASTNVTYTPVSNYQGTLAFSCTGLPAYTACAFVPATLTMTGNNAPLTTVLTIYTLNASAAKTGDRSGMWWLPAIALICFVAVRRRKLARTLRPLMVMGVAICALAAITGCGKGTFVTPAGTSTVTVVASSTGTPGTASGTVVQSFPLTLTIQ